ncbi:MAG: ubiquinol-cytochrome c reductase cytochrome c1 subunit [Bermanella sp.]|jgi:ubiquinol-cytochrome c reductase cytochrome c1 subunit
MKYLIAIIFAIMPVFAFAAGPSVPLDDMKVDLHDQASLQRGAKNFANHCMGCHSTKFARYNRVARDLGIPEDLMQDNLIFAETSIGSLMEIAMRNEDSKKWFGASPPDLTLVTRVRGADWVYTYLRSFYEDPSRPYGVNNLVYKDVGMPHVLEGLQGKQVIGRAPVAVGFDPLTGKNIYEEQDGVLFIEEKGQLDEKEFDVAIADLTNFLVYMAEPIALERQRIGYWVLLFLLILFVPVYYLNREFWRDIH